MPAVPPQRTRLGAMVALLMLGLARTVVAAPPPPANLGQVTGRYPQHAEVLRRALAEQGFAVLGDQPQSSLFQAYYNEYLHGVPVLVTSDAMLYLWFEAHRTLQQDVERRHLLPLTRQLVTQLQSASPAVSAGAPRGELVALAVAAKLAGVESAAPADIAAEAARVTDMINAAAVTEPYPGDDWQQYRPRGAYAQDAELAAYFRLAKWLGRHVLPLGGYSTTPDTVRSAAWWSRLLRSSPPARATWDQLAEARRWLAGPFNMSSVDELDRAFRAALGPQHDLRQLTAAECDKVISTLASAGYTATATRSRHTEELGLFPTRAFALLPEHDAPDSRLFQQQLDTDQRPTGLSVAAGLGFARAAELSRAPQARFAPDEHSVYGQWLGTLSALGTDEPAAPRYMRSAAWRDKTLNTVLTSWAQLKHDNVLYGATAMEAMGLPENAPKGWVEPLPTFWHRYVELVTGFGAGLAQRGLQTDESKRVLGTLAREAQWIEEDARLELAGRMPAHDQHWQQFCYVVRSLPFDQPTVIADVAGTVRDVLHVGSGDFQPLIVACEPPDRAPFAAVGWVGSYYEFWQPGFQRLTDTEWRAKLASTYGQPDPPSWTRSFRLEAVGLPGDVRARLRRAEALIRDGHPEQAIAGLRELRGSVVGTEGEVRAQALLGAALVAAKRWDEALAAYAACATMYGCRARDEARDEWEMVPHRRDWANEELAQQHTLNVALAQTAPRPGLSPAADLRRQNERAKALLDAETRDNSQRVLDRVLAECPRSGYVPGARLAKLTGTQSIDDLVNGVLDEFGRCSGPQPAAALLALAKEYHDSLVGEVAAGLAAFMVAGTQPEAAYAAVAPFLGAERATEPYPDAVHYLFGGKDHDFARICHLSSSLRARPVRREMATLASRILTGLATHGQFEAYLRLWPALERHLPQDAWPGSARFDHRFIVAEPDVYRAWAAADASDGDARRARLGELARRYPRAGLAPYALERLALGPGYDRPSIERLATEYPQSAPGLRAAAWLAGDAGDLARGEELLVQGDKLDTAQPGADFKEDGDSPGRPARSPSERWWAGIEADNFWAGEWSRRLPGTKRRDLFTARRRLRAERPSREAALAVLAALAGDQALAMLAEVPGGADYFAAHYPRSDKAPAPLAGERGDGPDPNDERLVNAGPSPAYNAAVERLAAEFGGSRGDISSEYDAQRARAETYAAEHVGLPTADLARVACAEALLTHDWPEQAVEVASPATGANRTFGDRAKAVIDAARRRLDQRRQPAAGPLWRAAVAAPAERYASFKSRAALTADTVLFAGRLTGGQFGLVALARDTGRQRWRKECGPLDSLAAAGGVVAGSRGGKLVAFDALSGQPRWTWRAPTKADARDDASSLVVAAGNGFVFAVDGRIVLLDAAGGAVRWQQPVPYPVNIPPMVVGERVLAVSQEEYRSPRTVYAFGLAKGEPLWTLDMSQYPTHGAGDVLSNGPLTAPDGSVVCEFRRFAGPQTWRQLDVTKGELLPAAPPRAALGALYALGGHLPWTEDMEVSGIGAPGGGRQWSADESGTKSRDGVLACTGDTVWLALSNTVVLLDPVTLQPGRRYRFDDEVVAFAGDGRGGYALLQSGQAVALAP